MLLRLAFRNIWRNRRRSLLTISAMVVSSSLLILALGIFSGMLRDMLASATEQYHGHLVISKEGYQDDRDMYAGFEAPEPLLEKIGNFPDVVGISPRLRGFGLASHERSTYPVEILGLLPGREKRVTSLEDKIVSGRFLGARPENGAVIGIGLAKKLGVEPGDELVYVTQAADGSIGNDLLEVVGIFRTGDAGHDNSLVLTDLSWLQRVSVLPGQVHELALGLADPMEAPEAAAGLRDLLPEGLEVLTWGDLLPEMREAIATFDVSRMIIVIILYFATGLGILNTFFMSVMERTREFGILMAVGMRPRRIRSMVLLEAMAMGSVSLLIGVILGLLMTLYMQRVGIDLSDFITPITYAGGTILPRLHAVIEAPNLVIPAVLLLLICLMAGYLPARRAANLSPVEAIREE